MPNHCSNSLTVSGPREEVSDFIKRVTCAPTESNARTGYAILDNLYPIPQELKDTVSGFLGDGDEQKALEEKQKANIAKYGHKDWYDWAYAKWGTKWGDYETDLVNESDKEAQFHFDSAWGPPVPGIVHVSGMFPNLKFLLSYEEGGMCFLGAVGIHNGEIVVECEGDYPEWEGDEEDPDWVKHMDAVCEERDRVNEAVEKILFS